MARRKTKPKTDIDPFSIVDVDGKCCRLRQIQRKVGERSAAIQLLVQDVSDELHEVDILLEDLRYLQERLAQHLARQEAAE